MSDHDGQNIEASVLAERERAQRDTINETGDRGPAKESGGAEAARREGRAARLGR